MTSDQILKNRVVTTRLVLRQDSVEHWLSSDLLLYAGEPAISYELNRLDGTKQTYRLKVGRKDPDGTLHPWRDLPYLNVDISDVIGLSSFISSINNTYYKLSSTDNINLHLMYSNDQTETKTWYDTGDIFSVSALTSQIDTLSANISSLIDISSSFDERLTCLEDIVSDISSDYTTSALVSAIVSGYLNGFELSDYYKKSETSSASEISSEFNKYQLSGDYATKTELSNNISSLSNTVDVKLSSYYKKSETSSSSEISNALSNIESDISAISSSLSDYYKKTETSSSSELSNEFLKYQLSGDYATKTELSNSISSLSNTVDFRLSSYWQKSETSSASELSIAFNNKVKIGSFSNDTYILSSSDLSVVKIAADDYYRLVAEEKYDHNAIYILSSDHLNAYDERIINVADPILSSDAATKNYVDSRLSNIELSDYYKKTETSCASELSIKFNTLSSFSNEWKSSVDISVANLSSAIKNIDDNKINIVNNVSDYIPKFTATGQLESTGKKIGDLLYRSEVIEQPNDTSALVQSKGIKDFVNSSINNMAAFYIAADISGNAFLTYRQLTTLISGYNAGVLRNPTKNDYAIVLSDEAHYDSVLSINPTTRYTFLGVYLSGGAWLFLYVVNNTTFTLEQVNAINSGITASKVLQIDNNASAITNIISDLTANYYKKTETSCASEISSALALKSKVQIITWED